MVVKKIPSAVIRRLPRYYRYLQDLLSKGITRISSSELSDRMHVTASQIRQDLNHFGGFGQQGYGYNVELLYTEIGHILGQDRTYQVIIIGAGNLGQAVANYTNYNRKGYMVCALFDSNPDLIGRKVRNIPVMDIAELDAFVKNNPVDIAILAIPKENASEIASVLVKGGIRAIWNFASIDLNFADSEVVVENVHLSDSLRVLTYRYKELTRDSSAEDI